MLFSGGVVKNKKLQRGNIYIFEDVLDQQKGMKGPKPSNTPGEPKYRRIGENPQDPKPEQVVKAYESVYLLKWLFPDTAVKLYQEKLTQLKVSTFESFTDRFVNS